MTLVDSNVVIDLFVKDPEWFDWSTEQLDRCSRLGPLQVNEVTYAELAARIDTHEDLQSALKRLGLELERAPTSALFAAGRAFNRYRAAGGPRTTVLPDFFIGAHAAAAGIPILTRDVRRYRAYFPEVRLIAPEA